MSTIDEFCAYLNARIQDLSRELDHEFVQWNSMLQTAIQNGARNDPEVIRKTEEYHRYCDILKKARDEFQRLLKEVCAPEAQV